MAKAVLDASAVLALLNDEPGAEAVAEVLDDAVMSTVNVAEVIGKLVERGSSLEQARLALHTIAIEPVDFTLPLAERTGGMRLETRDRGLSLGDRACLALAEHQGVPVLTCDRNWLEAIAGIEVESSGSQEARAPIAASSAAWRLRSGAQRARAETRGPW